MAGSAQPAVIEAIAKLKMSGFDVVVASHDPREARPCAKWVRSSSTTVWRPCSAAQVVITSLRTTAEVENLYLGDEGLLELMDPGTFCTT